MNRTIDVELREQLDRLPAAQQRQVLDFARALAVKARSSGRTLRRFACRIPKDDLRRIAEAIDDGCEQVTPDEW